MNKNILLKRVVPHNISDCLQSYKSSIILNSESVVITCLDAIIGERVKRVRHYQGCTNLRFVIRIYVCICIWTYLKN